MPPLLAAFAPEYKKETYHIHGRDIENWEAFRSIFLDEHTHGYLLISKMLKGALIGSFYGIMFRNFFLRGPKKFQMDRIFYNGG